MRWARWRKDSQSSGSRVSSVATGSSSIVLIVPALSWRRWAAGPDRWPFSDSDADLLGGCRFLPDSSKAFWRARLWNRGSALGSLLQTAQNRLVVFGGGVVNKCRDWPGSRACSPLGDYGPSF